MRLFARTGLLCGGAAVLGVAVNAARPTGISLLGWQATTVCESAGALVEVGPTEAEDLCREPGVLIVDVRSEEEFVHGHLPGALHLPCRQRRLGEETFAQLASAGSILVYGRSTDDARPVAESLAERQLPVRLLAGGYTAWERAGKACSSGPCEGCLGKVHDEH